MSDQTAPAPAMPRPTIPAGLGMVVAIFALSSLWVGIGGGILHLHSFFASFVFLWYWGVMDRMALARLPANLLGALVGVALAWQLAYLSAHYGTQGLAAGVAIIAVAVFIQFMNWAPFAVNLCGMLFLAILTAPQFMGHPDFIDVGETIVAGALYAAVLVFVGTGVMNIMAKRKAGSAR